MRSKPMYIRKLDFVTVMTLMMAGFISFAGKVEGFVPFKTSKNLIQQLYMSSINSRNSNEKGKLLVLGGTGFLGQTVCRRALLEGYSVTSLSRRGLPPSSSSAAASSQYAAGNIDFRAGDARQKETVSSILAEGGYVGTSCVVLYVPLVSCHFLVLIACRRSH